MPLAEPGKLTILEPAAVLSRLALSCLRRSPHSHITVLALAVTSEDCRRLGLMTTVVEPGCERATWTARALAAAVIPICLAFTTSVGRVSSRYATWCGMAWKRKPRSKVSTGLMVVGSAASEWPLVRNRRA
jgi:hypothetical protein